MTILASPAQGRRNSSSFNSGFRWVLNNRASFQRGGGRRVKLSIKGQIGGRKCSSVQ